MNKKHSRIFFIGTYKKMGIYFAFSVTFLGVNFTAIKKECFSKYYVLKFSQHSPENTCVVKLQA